MRWLCGLRSGQMDQALVPTQASRSGRTPLGSLPLSSLSLSLFLSICDCPPLRDGTCNGSSTPCSWAELREIPLNLRVCLPLAAIAPAGSNPAVLVLELRFEALRTALNDYSRMITDDFRTDVTAAKLAEMGMGK